MLLFRLPCFAYSRRAGGYSQRRSLKTVLPKWLATSFNLSAEQPCWDRQAASRPPRACRFCPPATFEMAPALLRRDRFPCKRDKRQDESWGGEGHKGLCLRVKQSMIKAVLLIHDEPPRCNEVNQGCQRNKVEREQSHAKRERSCAAHPRKGETCWYSESDHNNTKRIHKMF